MKNRILIVEDEEKIARVIQLELEYEGYEAKVVHTGKAALEAYEQEHFDLILLDVMIPQLNGMEVLRRIRQEREDIAIIMLTARDSVFDKVNGLDLGANDYMTKPFEIEELLARIRVHLRFNQIKTKTEIECLQIADLQLFPNTREVKRSEMNIELTQREYDLLLFFLENSNRVLDREQIITNVWGYDYYGDTNVVDVYVRYLRKKIDTPFDTSLIHTVRGVGYMIKE
ncbi:response regulator transcription factor [Bacillus sp. JJ722]|uniref:response regulator transcription factor n=1 Tax=Bacillus sp. JJ722 TaxID=3122973 RepID=UPI003000E171